MNLIKVENFTRETNINISVIVPIYNVEEYLSSCIDSLIDQKNLRLEIILVNDGSTDRSGMIANQYASQYWWIKVIHQNNRGASAARNAGLKVAQGEYIAFVDSDDWINQNSLSELYRKATEHQVDVLMSNIMKYFYQDVIINNPFNPLPKDVLGVHLSGKEAFIKLSKAGAYPPTPCIYIYRRGFLDKIQARFEEGIMHEDELWCPIIFYYAENFMILDINFYNYRRRIGSVMHSSSRSQRMDALFQVSDRLMQFAEKLNFSGENAEFKNWLYVIIFRLYALSFDFLSEIKDTSYIVPKYHINRFWRDSWEMIPEPQRICKHYYELAVRGLERYTNWCTSDWVASIAFQFKTGKRLMLIYNAVRGENLSLKYEDTAFHDWIITSDRRYFQHADVIVFYLPDLLQEMENDLEKSEGQIWVSWCLVETEKNYPWINDFEFKDLFDLQVYYPEDEINNEHPVIQLCRAIYNTIDEL